LAIRFTRRHYTQLLDFLRLFTAVRNLYLSRKSAQSIVPTMQELVGAITLWSPYDVGWVLGGGLLVSALRVHNSVPLTFCPVFS